MSSNTEDSLDNEVLECSSCQKRTVRIEADSRNFNTGRCAYDGGVLVPLPEERALEALAANIVHQIGDTLYDALPKDVAHEHFVDARQKTNDVAIDFAKKLIRQHESTLKAEYEEKVRQARIGELQRLIPNPVAEMASINYEDELKRLYDDLRERIAELNTPKNGEPL